MEKEIKRWMDDARSNADDKTIVEWFKALYNADVEIKEDLAVYIGKPTSGRWLTQSEIADACRRIDDGI